MTTYRIHSVRGVIKEITDTDRAESLLNAGHRVTAEVTA